MVASATTHTSTRDFYYTPQWQCIEERVTDVSTSTTTLNRQYIWGLRYVDDLVRRDRDTTGNGVLDETLYALNDRQFNVIALWDPSANSGAGGIVERMAYTPYGGVQFLNEDFTTKANTGYGWTTLFQGLHRDPATGLYHNRARELHPLLRRFLQRDPLGYPDGMNAYAAYHVMWAGVDPSGLDELEDNFLGATGVGQGITNETMIPVDGINGVTFTAEGCNGREDCDINFTFDQAYMGTYPYVFAGGDEVRGFYVKIRADFDAEKCACDCEEVKFIQIVRSIRKDANGEIIGRRPTSPIKRDRAGWDDRDAPSRGWRIDQSDGTDPFYGDDRWSRRVGDNGTAPSFMIHQGGMQDIEIMGRNSIVVWLVLIGVATARFWAVYIGVTLLTGIKV